MADESITKVELAAAFRRVKVTVGQPFSFSYYSLPHGASSGRIVPTPAPTRDLATYPDVLAGELFTDVKKHREPEYKDGKVYRDADGDVYQYDVKFDGTKRWYEPGSADAVRFDVPTRPLTYLG